MLKLQDSHLEIVKAILAQYFPKVEVRAFGSRVHGQNLKKYSDLDLVLMTTEPISSRELALLDDAFSESNLPIKVDVLDWSRLKESFQEKVSEGYEVIQVAKI